MKNPEFYFAFFKGWHKKILDLNQDLFDLFELVWYLKSQTFSKVNHKKIKKINFLIFLIFLNANCKSNKRLNSRSVGLYIKINDLFDCFEYRLPFCSCVKRQASVRYLPKVYFSELSVYSKLKLIIFNSIR
jgi:hypothetical protein